MLDGFWLVVAEERFEWESLDRSMRLGTSSFSLSVRREGLEVGASGMESELRRDELFTGRREAGVLVETGSERVETSDLLGLPAPR